MSTTDTTPTLELERGALTLVRVSDTYVGTADAYAPVFLEADNYSGEERDNHLTFYATTSRDDMGEGWATLIVPTSDPRSRSMWTVHGGEHYTPLGLEGEHRGWNIQRHYLSPVAVAVEGPDAAVEGPVDVVVTFTQSDVDAAVREARQAQRLEDLSEFEAWKERASEIACQYADDNNLCGEFERCMEEIGLTGRRREYVVSLSLTVEARDADAALEEVVERLYGDSWAIRQSVDEVEEI